MGTIDRFKKQGGEAKLLEILEESDDRTRDNLIKQIEKEDKEFLGRVLQKLFLWDNLFSLDPSTLGAILTRAPLKPLATALKNLDESKRQILVSSINHILVRRIDEEAELLGTPQPSVISASRRKICKIAREMHKDGSIKLPNQGK